MSRIKGFNIKNFNKFIELLYKNPDICHSDLAKLLNYSNSNLTSHIKRYSETESSLFVKASESKYCYYSLTEDGVKYYLESVEPAHKVEQEIQKSLISYILCQAEENQNPYTVILKQTDISTIASTFTINEFLLLSMVLGILPEDFCCTNIMQNPQLLNETKLYCEKVYSKFEELIVSQVKKEKATLLKSKAFTPKRNNNVSDQNN